jgi:hypothetical protein
MSSSRQPLDWKLRDLRRLIRDEVPESAYLEYKSGGAIAPTERAKKEIGKDISSFANAGGGTLIYGMEERDNKPVNMDGVDKKFDREWLDQVILTRIQPRVGGVRINVIPLPGKGKSAYVVWIPQSERGPHQASDKRFYSRRNFTVQPMEEYEIRDVYQRRRAPSITLEFFFRRHRARLDRFPVSWANPETLHQIELNAEMRNDGGGAVAEALITMVVDARILPPEIERPMPFQDLTTEVDGRSVSVGRLQLPSRGPSGLSLFKSVVYRLFDNDLPITFKKDWVEGAHPPFIHWDVRAPEMMPRTGFLELRRDRENTVLVPKEPPEFGAFMQDDRQRAFLAQPDLSFGSSILERERRNPH